MDYSDSYLNCKCAVLHHTVILALPFRIALGFSALIILKTEMFFFWPKPFLLVDLTYSPSPDKFPRNGIIGSESSKIVSYSEFTHSFVLQLLGNKALQIR